MHSILISLLDISPRVTNVYMFVVWIPYYADILGNESYDLLSKLFRNVVAYQVSCVQLISTTHKCYYSGHCIH